MPRESDQKQQSFHHTESPYPKYFQRITLNCHTAFIRNTGLHYIIFWIGKSLCVQKESGDFSKKKENGWGWCVCFSTIRVNFSLRIQCKWIQIKIWTWTLESWTVCSEQCHKYDECYIQWRYVITKSFRNKAQTRLLSIKSKIRMKCSHQCPKFHYPIATTHYSSFQFNF